MSTPKALRVAFIGAGGVNFGTIEGPWNHASRLECIADSVQIEVVGITDIDTNRALDVLEKRRAGKYPKIWSSTKVYGSVEQMIEDSKPAAAWIGLPPIAHGAASGPAAVELQCLNAGVHLFIEKPLSVRPPEEVAEVTSLLRKRPELVVSVGYMMRYLKAVQYMKDLLVQHKTQVRAVIAQYNSTYTAIAKPFWWTLDHSGGPIVEQGTHFCDLARFFGGDVDLSTVSACAIGAHEALGQLGCMPTIPGTDVPVDRDIPADQQIPRATVAVWKFTSGAVGSLTHASLLQGIKYSAILDVWADGLMMSLRDPYHKCEVAVRKPGEEEEQVLAFEDDDPYLAEDEAFIGKVMEVPSSGPIHSLYADAYKSYELTWAIRRSSMGK
jgi:predicted dehydrogenase